VARYLQLYQDFDSEERRIPLNCEYLSPFRKKTISENETRLDNSKQNV